LNGIGKVRLLRLANRDGADEMSSNVDPRIAWCKVKRVS